jgi:superfamily I DNA/RNA helicase
MLKKLINTTTQKRFITTEKLNKILELSQQKQFHEMENEVSNYFKTITFQDFTQSKKENIQQMMDHLIQLNNEKTHEFKKFPIYKAFWKISELQKDAGELLDSFDNLEKSFEHCKDIQKIPHLNITRASLFRRQNITEEAIQLLNESLENMKLNTKARNNEIHIAKAHQELGKIFETSKYFLFKIDKSVQLLLVNTLKKHFPLWKHFQVGATFTR